MPGPSVFISYSHDSPEHADRVLALADRLVHEGIDVILDQYETSPTEGWPRWMDKHIRSANFVLMVCTETYFRRVMGEEEPGTGLGIKWEGNLIYQHIYNADTTNSRFIPVLFNYSKVEHIPTPLQGASRYSIETSSGYEELYRRITNQPRIQKPTLGKLRSLPPRERKPDYLGVKVSTAKLPSTDPTLFGRKKELKALDKAWNNQKINVLSLVAWGGVGKSALVNKWLLQMDKDNYRGAERVYGWSFYSQGAAEGRQVSADQFIAAALEWLGDPDVTKGSPWDKGERLAELIKKQRTLLILDGLEPLQNPPPVETGKIKDPGLTSLLRELARQNPGLIVITTRLAVDDLKDFKDSTAMEIDLENLSPEAGAAYLRYLGVDGTDDERKQAAKDFAGHALALTLMGNYLKVVHRGDIRKRREIPHVMDEQKQGAHARRVIESYEQWLKGKPELDIVRLMGLFDRPAEKAALDALRTEPVIEGLTDALQKLWDADWQYAITNLRDLRLIAQQDPHEPDTLDCHPLLREHFGEKLKVDKPVAWQKGHSRLFEYYSLSAKVLPNTIEEMAPLFAAVMHGCQAERYQNALDEVYRERIARTNEYFSVRKLGAIGADLSALSGFFDPPWRQPISTLREDYKGYLLNEAGYDLGALGWLVEAAQPMQAGLDAAIVQKNWKNAVQSARNLSELYLTMGYLPQALNYARQSIELADRSEDAYFQIAARTTLADALHHAGRLMEADAVFREAEGIQEKKRLWSSPKIVSVWGSKCCNLLLSKERWQDVQDRANQSLTVGAQIGGDLLSRALDYLSLGRAHLLQSQRERDHPFAEASTYLSRAMDGLRQAGQQQELPRGLLARAEFYRFTGALDKAQKDLDEAIAIATRGGMRLFEADCHLEYAHWYLAKRDKAKAREHWEIAKKMIEEMGYHRRDQEVEEIEVSLRGAA